MAVSNETAAARSLRVKLTENAEPTAMTSQEFRAAVAGGLIVETTPVCGRIFTNGEWWSAADLRMFHDASPTKVPLGRHLQAEVDAREQKRAQEAHRAAKATTLLRRRAANVSALIPAAAARFEGSSLEMVWIMTAYPALRGEWLLVVEHRATGIHLEHIGLNRNEVGPDRLVAFREEGNLALDEVPMIARNALELERIANSAPTVEHRDCLDGVTYWFQYRSTRLNFSEYWINPNGRDVCQRQLVALANELLKIGFRRRATVDE